MQEKYRKHMTWWLDEFCTGDQVYHYVELFPELDSRLAKFAVDSMFVAQFEKCKNAPQKSGIRKRFVFLNL